MSSSWTFSLLKLTEVMSVKRDSHYDITSVKFNSEKVHEDDIFVRQDILHFSSGESKDYKYLKSP